MNSLTNLSSVGKKAVLALIFTALLVLSASAQTAQQQQGKKYGEPGFVGEPVNLNVVNTDIRDI